MRHRHPARQLHVAKALSLPGGHRLGAAVVDVFRSGTPADEPVAIGTDMYRASTAETFRSSAVGSRLLRSAGSRQNRSSFATATSPEPSRRDVTVSTRTVPGYSIEVQLWRADVSACPHQWEGRAMEVVTWHGTTDVHVLWPTPDRVRRRSSSR